MNYSELDLDGIPWNGPDYYEAVVGELIEADVWLSTGYCDLIFAYGFIICNYDGSLEYQNVVYHIPEWTSVEPVPGLCFDVQATDFTFSNPIQPPILLATITYRAAVDESIDDITFGACGIFCTFFYSDHFFDNVGATVSIGMTGTSQSSWGSVKGMFR